MKNSNKSITEKVRDLIKSKPNLTNLQIAKKLGVSEMQVKLNRTRIINGTIAGTAKATVKVTKTPKTKKVETFKNEDGVGKGVARIDMVTQILEISSKSKVILSLPSQTCAIEQAILKKAKSFIFIGVEAKEEVYWKMAANIVQNRLPITPVLATMGEKIAEARTNQYAHLILDYCGQLHSFADEIMLAMRNNIVEVNGTISITLNRRISGKGRDFANFLQRLNPQHDTSIRETEHLLRTFINRVGGYNYAIEKVLNYHDKASMILIIVRRIA
jgi:hypothetical protein